MIRKFFYTASTAVLLMFCSCAVVTLDLKPTRVYYHSEGCKLSGGLPVGGRYSGLGVENGIFYPEKTSASDPDSSQYEVEITYSYNGKSATSKIKVFGFDKHEPQVCDKCRGSRIIKCPVCHGNPACVKWTACKQCSGTGKITQDCSKCEGKGKQRKYLFFTCCCKTCNGSGKISIICPECDNKKLFSCCPNSSGRVECDKCSLKK